MDHRGTFGCVFRTSSSLTPEGRQDSLHVLPRLTRLFIKCTLILHIFHPALERLSSSLYVEVRGSNMIHGAQMQALSRYAK